MLSLNLPVVVLEWLGRVQWLSLPPTAGYSSISVESEMSLSSLLGYCSCSHYCCHLCSHEVWPDEVTAAECGELVGTSHSWIPNHGQYRRTTNRNGSINMLYCLSFPNGVSVCRHQRGGGLCLFLQVTPAFSVSTLDTKNVFVSVLTLSCNSGVSLTHPTSSLASESLITFYNSFFLLGGRSRTCGHCQWLNGEVSCLLHLFRARKSNWYTHSCFWLADSLVVDARHLLFHAPICVIAV